MVSDCMRIINALCSTKCWLSFDQLYRLSETDSNWIGFAQRLECLVRKGQVQYRFPIGADVGYYKINHTKTQEEGECKNE